MCWAPRDCIFGPLLLRIKALSKLSLRAILMLRKEDERGLVRESCLQGGRVPRTAMIMAVREPFILAKEGHGVPPLVAAFSAPVDVMIMRLTLLGGHASQVGWESCCLGGAWANSCDLLSQFSWRQGWPTDENYYCDTPSLFCERVSLYSSYQCCIILIAKTPNRCTDLRFLFY